MGPNIARLRLSVPRRTLPSVPQSEPLANPRTEVIAYLCPVTYVGMTARLATDQTLLLNLEEVADQLRCTRRNVERLIADHQLPVVRFGRSVRVERAALEAFVAANREDDD